MGLAIAAIISAPVSNVGSGSTKDVICGNMSATDSTTKMEQKQKVSQYAPD